MINEARNDIQKNMEIATNSFKIAIDTGKAFTKYCYKQTESPYAKIGRNER